MAIPETLLQFIKDALGRGIPRNEVETALIAAGWEREQVSAGLASFAFIYLLLFTALYLSVYHLGRLVLHFIDLAIPDPASNESRRYLVQQVRFSV